MSRPSSSASKTASAKTFIDDKHTTAHNKLIIIDGNVVITGSFNFTDQSENETPRTCWLSGTRG